MANTTPQNLSFASLKKQKKKRGKPPMITSGLDDEPEKQIIYNEFKFFIQIFIDTKKRRE